MIDFLKRLSDYKDSLDECSNCGKPIKKGKKFCSYKCQIEGKDVYTCVVCGRKTVKYHVYCKKCKGKKRGITEGKMKVARKNPTKW